MRLAQLARKFGITQNQIVSILKSKGFDVVENGNVKLSLEEVAILKDHVGFKEPPTTEERIDEKNIEQQVEDVESLPTDNTTEESEVLTTQEKETLQYDTVEQASDTQEPEDTEQSVEVIRAKKVKLEGIKVVGKIELPEPPQAEEAKEETEKQEDIPQRRKQKPQKNRTRPSYEEKLKREEERAERERKKRIKKLKEKKKNHYYEQVQPKVVANNKKKKKKSKPEKPKLHKNPLPQYKNPLRKFWAWINGEYDRG